MKDGKLFAFAGLWKRWEPEVHEPDKLNPLLKPYSEEEMEFYPVGFGVNNPKYDGEELIKLLQVIANTKLFL
jgi:putative SOS response-associated peptidase YedK